MKLTGKKALITGGNSGIGLCYSPTFHCGGRIGRHYWSRPEDAR